MTQKKLPEDPRLTRTAQPVALLKLAASACMAYSRSAAAATATTQCVCAVPEWDFEVLSCRAWIPVKVECAARAPTSAMAHKNAASITPVAACAASGSRRWL